MDQFLASLSEAWEGAKSALAFFGAAGLSITGIAAAAYALFKFFGEKWLSQKFAEQLESYKAEQARELERLRHKINGVFDRTKRLHDREYDVLPGIWAKLVEAKTSADGYLSPFQEYPDVRSMNEIDLDEFLGSTRFSEGQKRSIKNAPDRLKAYIDIFERYRYGDVAGKLADVSVSLKKDGIFVLPPLREDIQKLIDLIHAAVVEHQINREEDVRPRMKDEKEKLKRDGNPLFKQIEEAVSARLWDPVTADI